MMAHCAPLTSITVPMGCSSVMNTVGPKWTDPQMPCERDTNEPGKKQPGRKAYGVSIIVRSSGRAGGSEVLDEKLMCLPRPLLAVKMI